MRNTTNEELYFLVDLKNRFWLEFSALCNKYIAEARARDSELEYHAEEMLGEATSIYGRKGA